MKFMPEKLKGLLVDDLLDAPSAAYAQVSSALYEAEKGLLELYRSFVSEMLRISLAGVAVLGFLSKFLAGGEKLPPCPRFYGTISMFSFALSAALCLLFLYLSADGYRYYIAGLRSSIVIDADSSASYLRKRKIILRFCIGSKIGSAFLIAAGAFSACIAIINVV